MEAKVGLDKQSAPKPAGKGERGAFPGASVGTGSAATQAHLCGKEGAAWSLQGRGSDPGDFCEACAYFPSAVRARQTKGRDTGAQVSSSSPGQGGGGGQDFRFR